MKYVKLEYDHVLYYVQENLLSKATQSFQQAPGIFGRMRLTQFSDFVIDTRTNDLTKCRVDLESIVDAFVDNMQQHPL